MNLSYLGMIIGGIILAVIYFTLIRRYINKNKL